MTSSELEEAPQPSQPVIIFDGVCGLCNHTVDFIIKHDKDKQFLFAPNQSEAAQNFLKTAKINTYEINTIYLYDDGKFYEKSTAVFRITSRLPWPWKAANIGRLLPPLVRDWAYQFVAKNRYRWFGKHETCRIPTPEERSRFL